MSRPPLQDESKPLLCITAPSHFFQLLPHDILGVLGIFLTEHEVLEARLVNKKLNDALDNEFNKRLLVSLLAQHATKNNALIYDSVRDRTIRFKLNGRWGIYLISTLRNVIKLPSVKYFFHITTPLTKENILTLLNNQTAEVGYAIHDDDLDVKRKRSELRNIGFLHYHLLVLFLLTTMIISLVWCLNTKIPKTLLLNTYFSNNSCGSLPCNELLNSSALIDVVNCFSSKLAEIYHRTHYLRQDFLQFCDMSGNSCNQFRRTFSTNDQPQQSWGDFDPIRDHSVWASCVAASTLGKFLSVYGAILVPIFLFLTACAHDIQVTRYGDDSGDQNEAMRTTEIEVPASIIRRIRNADFFRQRPGNMYGISLTSGVQDDVRFKRFD